MLNGLVGGGWAAACDGRAALHTCGVTGARLVRGVAGRRQVRVALPVRLPERCARTPQA